MNQEEKLDFIIRQIKKIENKVKPIKEPYLTLDQVLEIVPYAKSTFYKLVHYGEVPHYKPNNKVLFFKESEIRQWVDKTKSLTNDELFATVENDKKALETVVDKARIQIVNDLKTLLKSDKEVIKIVLDSLLEENM